MDTSNIDIDTEYEDDNASEMQILTWRTLINLVKPNSVLYEKKAKGYSKKCDKNLIWNRIGEALVPPMTGSAAEKEFYRLRQKFGKERRKVVQSQARSGAGGNSVTYKSNWILYNDLMFLADHIQPRQTTSNYQRPIPVSQKLPNVQTQQLVTSTPPSYPSTRTPPPSSSDTSDCWNIDLLQSLSRSTSNEDEGLSSTTDSVDSCLSVPVTSNKSSTASGNASASMLKAMASAIVPQKQIPPSDIAKKRKRNSNDDMDKTILESSKNVSSLASTLDIVLKERISTRAIMQQTPEVSPEVQNMMGSIALGLSKVSVECQMDCLIQILSCINQFVKK